MLEKFTQKAIDIVQNAQIQAGNLGSDKVLFRAYFACFSFE